MSWNRIAAILKKEFLQMKRDRMTLALIFMIPLVQLILFGYAIQTEVKHIPTVVFDQSLSMASRDVLDSFSASGLLGSMGAGVASSLIIGEPGRLAMVICEIKLSTVR